MIYRAYLRSVSFPQFSAGEIILLDRRLDRRVLQLFCYIKGLSPISEADISQGFIYLFGVAIALLGKEMIKNSGFFRVIAALFILSAVSMLSSCGGSGGGSDCDLGDIYSANSCGIDTSDGSIDIPPTCASIKPVSSMVVAR